MFELLYFVIKAIQPFLVPICFFTAWYLVILVTWGLWTATRDTVKKAQEMHQIPCTSCQFFTNDYRLKCTVRPCTANTEEAINCMDYQPKTNPMLY